MINTIERNIAIDARPTFDVYTSKIDGVVVVHIDTQEMPENERGPLLRVYINDDIENPIWDNTKVTRREDRL